LVTVGGEDGDVVVPVRLEDEDEEDELEGSEIVVEEDSEGCWGVEVGNLGVEVDEDGEGLGEGLGVFVGGLGEATGGDELACGFLDTVAGTGVMEPLSSV
jgi:hypothetical protein